MIDLKKLEEKFEALFSVETEETFNEWLKEKQKNEIFSQLGGGVFENITTSIIWK